MVFTPRAGVGEAEQGFACSREGKGGPRMRTRFPHGVSRWRCATGTLVSVLFLGLVLGCTEQDYRITITHHDPAQAQQGTTFFQTHVFHPGYFGVDMDGEVLWHRFQPGVIVGGNGVGMDVMRNGNVLIMSSGSYPAIVDPATDETLWTDEENQGHHSVAETPWGTVLTLQTVLVPLDYPPWEFCAVYGDRILEIGVPSGEVLWEWDLADHVDPLEHHADGMCAMVFDLGDWSHCNTVKVIEGYRFRGRTYPAVLLLLSRNLDTFWMIDYPGGDVIWSFGQHGDFGRRDPPQEPLFMAGHDIGMLENGNFLLYDNGDLRQVPVSRALEFSVDPVARTYQEVWSWTDPGVEMFSSWGGSVDRLPNGNTLLTDVQGARIVEVNPAGEKVWELEISTTLGLIDTYSVFLARRVPYEADSSR